MDLNYYMHREQVERIRAEKARSQAVREAHSGLADLYRERIETYRRANRAEIARPAQH